MIARIRSGHDTLSATVGRSTLLAYGIAVLAGWVLSNLSCISRREVIILILIPERSRL